MVSGRVRGRQHGGRRSEHHPQPRGLCQHAATASAATASRDNNSDGLFLLLLHFVGARLLLRLGLRGPHVRHPLLLRPQRLRHIRSGLEPGGAVCATAVATTAAADATTAVSSEAAERSDGRGPGRCRLARLAPARAATAAAAANPGKLQRQPEQSLVVRSHADVVVAVGGRRDRHKGEHTLRLDRDIRHFSRAFSP